MLVEEWRSTGGVPHHLQAARSTRDAIIGAMGDDDAAAFVSSFDALPDTVRTAAFRGMATDAGSTKPGSDESVAAFSGICAEAAALTRAWGSKAGARLGQACARLDQMTASMSDTDAAQAHAWLGALPLAQRAAIVSALAGKR